MDKLDLLILKALQNDGRQTYTDIAEKFGIDKSKARRRIKILEAEHVILSYRALIDANKIGLKQTILLMVKLKSNSKENIDKFITSVEKISPNVVECMTISGAFDFALKIVAEDYSRCTEIWGELSNNFEIKETTTYVCSGEINAVIPIKS